MNYSSVARLLLVPVLGMALVVQAAEPASVKAAEPAKKPVVTAKSGEPEKKGAAVSKDKQSARPAEVPPEVLEAMSKLVESAVQEAGRELEKGVDEFLPYGVVLLKSGEAKMVRWQKPNPPPLPEVMRAIVLTLRQIGRTPDVVAAVSVAPTAVNTEEGIVVKGIRCEVDHRDGEPRIVFVPYTREDGKVLTGTPVYLPGKNPIFVRPGDQAAAAAAQPAAKAPAGAKKP